MPADWSAEVADLVRRRALVARMGGTDKIARQHAAGRLTVRERITALVDVDSFQEVGSLAGFSTYGEDGRLEDLQPANFIVGTARVDARKVIIGADDFTVRGGAGDASIYQKQVYAEELANTYRLPLVRLIEGTGGGGSVKMLEDSGFTYVPVNPAWDLVVDNLSVVPVIAVGAGPVAGLGAARAVMSHLSIFVTGVAQLFVAGPALVTHATGQELSKDQLGGYDVHRRSGAVERWVDSEAEAFDVVRRFLSYLPSSVDQIPLIAANADPADRADEALLSLVPHDRRKVYRLKPLLDGIFDVGSVLQYAEYGGSVFTGLARLDGHPVGVIATDPYKGAAMTAQGAQAMTRLVDLCTTFHLPLVSLTDQSGLSIGLGAEKAAVIRHGARAVSAAYQANVPTAEIIIRRVFGVGGAGQVNRHSTIRRWAWPSGDWGSLPIEGGIEAAYRAELDAADDRSALLERIRQRLDAVRSPLRTAEKFAVEDIIDPRHSRALLCDWVIDAYRLLPALVGRPTFGVRP